MGRRKSGIGTIEINKKFIDEKEAELYMKRLIDYIYNISKKKCYKVSAMIVISNMRKGTSSLEYKSNGKKGRPKVSLNICDSAFNKKWYKGNYCTDWHLHITLLSSPSYALRNNIKDYIDKNWLNIENIYEKKDFDYKLLSDKKVYKKKCNISICDYFIEQSSKRRFININFSNEEDFKYSIKDYYKEYMKMKSNKSKLISENIKKPMNKEKYLKKYYKIESKFKEINDYLLDYSKLDDIKDNIEFMNLIKMNKIKENYNKVQKKIVENI